MCDDHATLIKAETRDQKLRVLAAWLDAHDDRQGFTGPREVQADLRSLAADLASAVGELRGVIRDLPPERERTRARLLLVLNLINGTRP